MAAQPEHRGNRPPHAGAQITVVEAARRVDRRTAWVSALTAAGVFAMGAGSIHAATIGDQLGISTLYGLTFVAFAVGQIGWGLLALALPSRPLAALGALGNAAVMGLWVVTRTTGPPAGPLHGARLPVGFPDAVATTLEGLAVVTAVVAFALARRHGEVAAHTRTAVVGGAVFVAAALATLAILTQTGVLTSLVPSY